MSENNIIRNTVLNVTASFLKQESKINEKLDGVLEKKFEKVEFNEAKYAELLKFNILFYKDKYQNKSLSLYSFMYTQSVDFIWQDIRHH